MSADYRLPDGSCVGNVQEMIAAWNALKKPIEEAIGVRACAYDPGIVFFDPATDLRFDLPCWAIEKLNAALTKELSS